MQVEYKKDLRNTYMVIKSEKTIMKEIIPEKSHVDNIEQVEFENQYDENENNTLKDYRYDEFSIKMLKYQQVEGLLSLERRCIDNMYLYYYDITSKQSLHNVYEKLVLSYNQVNTLLKEIIKTIEGAYEYLLVEDDFILMPEYIYIDLVSDKIYFSYYPGYQRNMKDQMSSFIEYLMNKIDYNDKEVVLTVYGLYTASKKEGFTIQQISELIHKNTNISVHEDRQKPHEINTVHQIEKDMNCKEEQKLKKSTYPVMMEKLEEEAEILYYPIKTYLYAMSSILLSFICIGLILSTKVVMNRFGNRIDYSKLFIIILLVLCLEGYMLTKILDKKNKVTKIVSKIEYIDPLQVKSDGLQKSRLEVHKITLNGDDNNLTSVLKEIEKDDGDNNPTSILKETFKKTDYILKPLDEKLYKNIIVTEFPFFIGKLKKNVDYCLDEEIVSRYHAKLIKEEGKVFIIDLNSTNGTFLNKEMLPTYQKIEIKNHDEISFATIGYKFIDQT